MEYLHAAVEDAGFRAMLDAAAVDAGELLTIAVCLRDPDLSLSTGLSLPPVYGAYLKYLASAATWKSDASFLDLAAMPAHRRAMQRFAAELWCLTSEDLRFANRYQVEMYGIYARYAGHEALCRMEHLRWCADRSIIGYRSCVGTASDIAHFRLHNLIVPFRMLHEREKGKDADVFENMEKVEALSTGSCGA